MPGRSVNTRTDFLARQLLFLRRSGLDRAEAEARLHAELGDGELLETPHGDTPLLGFLDTFRAELGPHFEAVELGVSEFQREAAAAFRPIWRALRAVVIHAALVTAVAAVLMTAPAVMGSFQAAFETFDGELPRLTRMVLMPAYRNPLFLLLLLGVAGLFWLLRRMRQIFSLSKRDGGWLARHATQGFGLLDFWLVLALAIMRAACRSGMEVHAAVSVAQRVVAGWSRLGPFVERRLAALQETIVAAQRLGTLDAELAYQIEQRWPVLPLRVIERAELLSMVVNLLLGCAIGTLVAAVYLPIFKLASLIG